MTNARSGPGAPRAARDGRRGARALALALAVATTTAGLAAAPAGLAQPPPWAFRTYDARDLGAVPAAGSEFAGALVSGDFDGDRVPDLVVAAPRDGAAATGAGMLTIVYGGRDVPARRLPHARAEVDLRLGGVLAVGDFNGDDVDDLVMGTPLSDFTAGDGGALWLWEGGTGGPRGQPRPFGPPVRGGDRLGAALAVGDVDGDGIDDLAVGAPGALVNGRSGAGRAYIMPGRLDAGPVLGGALAVDRDLADVPGAPLVRENLGTSLAFVNLDGDDFDDLVVGVAEAAVEGQRGAGELIVAHGAGRTVTDTIAVGPVITLTRATEGVPGDPERGGAFGTRLLGADFDGDGYGDLAIGSPDADVDGARDAGDVLVVRGGPSGVDLARVTRLIATDADGAPDGRAAFGAALAAGDLDGDGRPELVVGAPGATVDGLPGVGAVVIVPSSADGPEAAAALRLDPGLWPLRPALATGLSFGAAVALGDWNGDRARDLAIGVPGQRSAGITAAGALVVAWNDAAGLPGIPTATATVAPSPTAVDPTATATGPTPTPITPTATPIPPTATPTPTPRPLFPAYLPYAARLHFNGRWGNLPIPPAAR